MLVFFVFLGCQVPAKQVKKQSKSRFSKDVKIGLLTANCSYGVTADACSRIQQITGGVEAMTQLHATQRAEWVQNLAAFSLLLRQPEGFPFSNVEIEKPSVTAWKSLNRKYVVRARLRQQYLSGRERHPKSQVLMRTMQNLVKISKAQRKKWSGLERAFIGPLDLGEKVAKERRTLSISMRVASVNFNESVAVPADLAKRFLSGLSDTQHLDLALVDDSDGVQRQYLGSRWLKVQPAFRIVASSNALSITETPALASTKTYKFEISAKRFCNGLRGELRHVERGERPKISWRVRDKKEVR